MDRRTVIKNLALVIGGTVLLPSCLHKDGFSYIQLKHISLNQDQEALIADICETIIPKTNTPGAKDLNLPQFVLKMLDDCYNKKSQLAFAAGLEEFKNQVSKKYNKDFSDLEVKDKEAFLISIEKSGKPKVTDAKAAPPINNSKPQKGVDVPSINTKPQKEADVPPINAFYSTIKQQTIFAYTTSQFFMTKEIVYELVPGRYNAHFPVKNLKTA
jgi:Gluconate 2-dehydrogenase subunit 3